MAKNFDLFVPYKLPLSTLYGSNLKTTLDKIDIIILDLEEYGKTIFDIEYKKIEKDDYLVFRTNFDLELETEKLISSYPIFKKELTREGWQDWAWKAFSETAYEHICNFFVICHICKPGCFSIEKRPYAIINNDVNKKHEKYTFRNSIDAVMEHFLIPSSRDTIFPPLFEIPIETAQTYFLNSQGFWGGYSQTNVGRAMHCFTNFFDDDYHWVYPNDFLWSMIGLEALYGQGNQNMMSQIIQKSKIFLNLNDACEKKIKEMYDFRSRVFHGQVNITNKVLFNKNSSVKPNKYTKKEEQVAYDTIYLFLLSLQKCIYDKVHDLNFKYVRDP